MRVKFNSKYIYIPDELKEIKGIVKVFGKKYINLEKKANNILVMKRFNLQKTSLFLNADLLIIEELNLLGHAFIVAREFEKPIIIGSKDFYNLQNKEIRLFLEDKEYEVIE